MPTKNRFAKISVILIFSTLLPLEAFADGIDSLKSFYQNTNAIRAQFHQTVVDGQGRKLQEVDGSMQLQRPGKFRWDYNKPYVQQIVGDGEKVWLYDPDLNQVTVRTISKALGSSPAALLAGGKDMDKAFELKNEGRQDNLDWVQAIPKDKESGFDTIYLGFKADVLNQMELHDSFGHVTLIEFNKLERNPKLNSQVFKFSPPSGADLVGD
ncbi:outer membrane lipoprotein chaperone LolA [Methyloradius palustris]|uniref:Outer-membrane lipoprotein carrier protein n=1 Tax=Methyloradius palustris TaxID=2778876 RepID=A0A8D5GDT0_9PROT|nr:outer membrane lipoprotein chaperone LolA [Methyloradius palustris]BCM24789.1 outer-membrane lipoprotein carrier protein [Methyloradius palustris]